MPIEEMGKLFRYIIKTNWIKTIWMNFRTLPLSQAYKLPIVLSWHTHIRGLGGGKIQIVCDDLWCGMIRLGYANMPVQDVRSQPLSLCLESNSKLTFKGNCRISAGSQIYLRGGFIEIGEDSKISMNVKMYSCSSIVIGSDTTIGWDSQIIDTDFHKTIDVNTGNVYPMTKKVEIGSHCWICNGCSIMKGTVIPDYVIVGSKSVCNKVYDVPKYSVIAGTPAVFKKEGLTYEF